MHMLFTVFSVSEEESDIILACSISLNNFITNKCKISTKVYIFLLRICFSWFSVPLNKNLRSFLKINLFKQFILTNKRKILCFYELRIIFIVFLVSEYENNVIFALFIC